MQFVHPYKEQEYGEESQDRKCKFAFAKVKKGDVTVLHQPVLCRSFLDDTLVWKAGEIAPSKIYGYTFHGDIDTKKTTLYITDEAPNPLANNLEYLHKIEKEVGIKPTKVTTVDGKEHLVEADKWWMKTTVHFSWFTFLLRQLTYPTKVTSFEDIPRASTFDEIPQKHFKDFHKVLAKLDVTKVRGSREDTTGTTMHEYNGFYSQVNKPQFTTYGNQIKALLNELQPS
jgi:hypothetical protein